MNSCCTIYYYVPNPDAETVNLELENSSCNDCGECKCGYIQFEDLVPYMTKLTNNYTKDEDHIILEAKLRQQIVQVSRLFDLETLEEPGAYATAHEKVIKLYGDGSRYLKIPEFIKGTLELYTEDGYLINPSSYNYENGYLVLYPCITHTSQCGCTSDCGMYEKNILPPGWKGCLQAKAKFGYQCSEAIKMAIRDYIIEHNSYGDVKETNHLGLPIQRGFKKPDSWMSAVKALYKRKKTKTSFYIA